MKAIVQDRYGSPDVLELRDVDGPVADDRGVLVRVHAAAVNARDRHLMRGDPYLGASDVRIRRAGDEDRWHGLRGPCLLGPMGLIQAFGAVGALRRMRRPSTGQRGEAWASRSG